MSIVDRFNILRETIQKGTSRNALKQYIREESSTLGREILQRIQHNAPSGEDWEDPPDVFKQRKKFYARTDPRPSLRQHGITLEDGWLEPRLDFRGSSRSTINAAINISNTAPQARWVTEGTVNKRGYIVADSRSRLFFHWHREDVTVFPVIVRHFGIQKNPFVEESYRQSSDLIDRFNRKFRDRFTQGFDIS